MGGNDCQHILYKDLTDVHQYERKTNAVDEDNNTAKEDLLDKFGKISEFFDDFEITLKF